MKFTIGTDTEFFLRYKWRSERFVASQPFLGDRHKGTKHNPIKMKCGATIQRDNVAIEFATTVANSLFGFKKAIADAMEDTKKILPKDVSIVATPSVVFDDDQLEHPEALEFGCDPDFNAWAMAMNAKPCAVNQNLRSAGGHIHVGHKLLLDPLNKIIMIRLMDIFLGLPFTVLDSSPEALRRKELYGKAGAYRPTPYGVEYRTLSNYWMSSDKHIEFVYYSTGLALSSLGSLHYYLKFAGGAERVQQVINSGDKNKAKYWYQNTIKHHWDLHSNTIKQLWKELING